MIIENVNTIAEELEKQELEVIFGISKNQYIL